MLTILICVLLLVWFAICLIRSINRKRVLFSIISAATILLVFSLGCYLVRIAVNGMKNGFSYELNIDKEKLETLIIDLDTPQQYEEWFCPDELFSSFAEYSIMSKNVELKRPDGSIDIKLFYYSDAKAAIQSFDYHFKLEEEMKKLFPEMYHAEYKRKKLNEEYEYCFTNTRASPGPFLFLVPDSYVSEVKIRLCNVVIEFDEFSYQRKSRIGEAIDQLWANYERYKEEMEMPP